MNELLRLLGGGKTKNLWLFPGSSVLAIESKDDITAGDGKKHDTLADKAVLSTRTTCNVFEYLNRSGLPLAYIGRGDRQTEFLALRCLMIPYEVVVRFDAYGSYCKRFPNSKPMERLPEPIVELFLKTSGRRWGELHLPRDDPFVKFKERDGKMAAYLHRPDIPFREEEPFAVLDEFPLSDRPEILGQIVDIALKTSSKLNEVWAALGKHLVDFKLEFGFEPDGKLVIADVIDNDSWRILDESGKHLDKQLYRNGASLDEVLVAYRLVADETEKFLSIC